MKTRKASIKESGEELSQAEWARFDAAVAAEKAKRAALAPTERDRTEAPHRDPRDQPIGVA